MSEKTTSKEVLVTYSTKDYDLQLYKNKVGSIILWRKSKRSKIVNRIGQYTINKDNGESLFNPLKSSLILKIPLSICS